MNEQMNAWIGALFPKDKKLDHFGNTVILLQWLQNLPDKIFWGPCKKRHIATAPLSQGLLERGLGSKDVNEHPTGFMSQKGLGMLDQPDRRHSPQGTRTVHLQGTLGKRRGKLGPAMASEFRGRGGRCHRECPYQDGGASLWRGCWLGWGIFTGLYLTHSKKNFRPDWENMPLIL